MRQISLDTETTGLLFYEGHKITEIGCVEIIDRKITNKTFHTYINPCRPIDKEAIKITGITDNFLKDKPLFKDIMDDFFSFLNDAEEIIIHNAKFDINFINNELKINSYKIKDIRLNFKIFDTLNFARKIHPGKKNNLNALCERYNIDNKERTLHGGLLDAQILAKVYLAMTSKQANITFKKNKSLTKKFVISKSLKTLKANEHELKKHITYINHLKNYK